MVMLAEKSRKEDRRQKAHRRIARGNGRRMDSHNNAALWPSVISVAGGNFVPSRRSLSRRIGMGKINFSAPDCQLRSLVRPFAFDARGYRVSESYPQGGTGIPAGEINYIYYNSNWQAVETRTNGTAASDVTSQMVWSAAYINAAILQDNYSAGVIQPNSRLYYLQDANWNTTAVVGFDSATGAWGVTQRYVYSPYGSITILNADWSTPPSGTQPIVTILHQGMTLDVVTGLYDERFRNYSPSLGTWISQAPLRYVNGANTYQFVMGNPIKHLDPSGEEAAFLTIEATNGSPYGSPMYLPPPTLSGLAQDAGSAFRDVGAAGGELLQAGHFAANSLTQGILETEGGSPGFTDSYPQMTQQQFNEGTEIAGGIMGVATGIGLMSVGSLALGAAMFFSGDMAVAGGTGALMANILGGSSDSQELLAKLGLPSGALSGGGQSTAGGLAGASLSLGIDLASLGHDLVGEEGHPDIPAVAQDLYAAAGDLGDIVENIEKLTECKF